MMNEYKLVTVKDMYGDRFHLRADHLAGGRTLLRMHSPDTGKPLPSPEDSLTGRGVFLHRGNICVHAEDDLQPFTDLGRTLIQCRICRVKLDEIFAEHFHYSEKRVIADAA